MSTPPFAVGLKVTAQWPFSADGKSEFAAYVLASTSATVDVKYVGPEGECDLGLPAPRVRPKWSISCEPANSEDCAACQLCCATAFENVENLGDVVSCDGCGASAHDACYTFANTEKLPKDMEVCMRCAAVAGVSDEKWPKGKKWPDLRADIASWKCVFCAHRGGAGYAPFVQVKLPGADKYGALWVHASCAMATADTLVKWRDPAEKPKGGAIVSFSERAYARVLDAAQTPCALCGFADGVVVRCGVGGGGGPTPWRSPKLDILAGVVAEQRAKVAKRAAKLLAAHGAGGDYAGDAVRGGAGGAYSASSSALHRICSAETELDEEDFNFAGVSFACPLAAHVTCARAAGWSSSVPPKSANVPSWLLCDMHSRTQTLLACRLHGDTLPPALIAELQASLTRAPQPVALRDEDETSGKHPIAKFIAKKMVEKMGGGVDMGSAGGMTVEGEGAGAVAGAGGADDKKHPKSSAKRARSAATVAAESPALTAAANVSWLAAMPRIAMLGAGTGADAIALDLFADSSNTFLETAAALARVATARDGTGEKVGRALGEVENQAQAIASGAGSAAAAQEPPNIVEFWKRAFDTAGELDAASADLAVSTG